MNLEPNEEVKEVFIVGEFTDWKPTLMIQDPDDKDNFTLSASLP